MLLFSKKIHESDALENFENDFPEMEGYRRLALQTVKVYDTKLFKPFIKKLHVHDTVLLHPEVDEGIEYVDVLNRDGRPLGVMQTDGMWSHDHYKRLIAGQPIKAEVFSIDTAGSDIDLYIITARYSPKKAQ